MLTVRRSFDYAALNAAVTHRRLINWLCDDGFDTESLPEEYPDSFIILEALQGDKPAGFFVYHPTNCATVEVHTVLLPCAWGDDAIELAKASTAWIFENTNYQRIITQVPENNRHAQNLACNAGLIFYGVNQKSWLKGGELYDLHLFGLSKKD